MYPSALHQIRVGYIPQRMTDFAPVDHDTHRVLPAARGIEPEVPRVVVAEWIHPSAQPIVPSEYQQRYQPLLASAPHQL